MVYRPSDRGGPMGPEKKLGPTDRGDRCVTSGLESNLDECGVKKDHTIGGDGLGAQRGRYEQLVGVNCNTMVSRIW